MGTSVQNFFTSRDNNVDPATYVGQLDRLWYNPDTNQIFISDGTTPGGRPVDLGANSNILVNTLTVSNITSPGGTVALTGNLTISGNISPAAANRIGGITPGPGVEISDTGLLTIDSAGLPISFGDFFANVNQLSMVNADEDMYLVSNGTGNINLIGGVNFYKPNGFPPSVEPFFRAKSDGQVQILVPAEDPIEGGVEIIGSASGNYIAPGTPGTMLQLTGNPDISCRIYQDSIGSYSSFVGRRYNGNVASPTQVLAGQDVLRFNATAATDAGVGNVSLAQISITALEDQTTTAQGSSITFTVTPIGSPANARVNVATVTVANGVSATKFTTAGTVSATGNITGGNILGGANVNATTHTGSTVSVTANITGGNILTGGAVSATGGITSGDGISDSKGDVRSIPLNTQNTGYTLVATDAGKMINMTTGNVTVPASVFATPFGQAITIYNNQNSSNAIVQGSGVTIRLAGTAATGNRTLERYSLATLVCVSANTFVISGAGLS